MFRKICFILVVLLLVTIMFIGCGQQPADDTEKTNSEENVQNTEDANSQVSETDIMNLHLKMMTGSAGGVWFPTGSAIAEFLKKDYPNLNVTMTPGGGVSNIAALQKGECDLAFGKTSSTVDGMEGREPFTEKTEKARELVFLNEEIFQIIVPADSPIKSVADIKGKILTTAQKGNTTTIMAEQLLECYGMTFDDLKQTHFVSFSDSITQMKDKKADIFIVSTSLPAATVLDLASSKDIRLLSIEPEIIDKMHALNPGYIKKTVPAGSYDFQKEDVTTIATGLHIAVSEDMPEEVAYNITKSIVEHIDEIKLVHDMYETLTPEMLATDIGIPFHPGALKYYQEAGLIK